jgi:hypothetical protein
MKFFLSLLFFSMSSFAQGEKVRIEKVHSIDFHKDEAMVTFWSDNQVYRMPKDDKSLPCLQNAFKGKQEVALGMKKESKVILDCKLYGKGKIAP